MIRVRLFLMTLCLLIASLATAQGYVINDFHVDIDLRKEATMTVKETIKVTFNEPRHGIFRNIIVDNPTGGMNRSLRIYNISVTDESGNDYETKETRDGDELIIRIGDADVEFDAGTKKTYVIQYDVKGMMNWFDQEQDWQPSAQLYWNVTGTKWDCTIESSSFEIRFPAVPGGKGLRAKVFSGEYGSTANQLLNRLATDAYGPETDTTLSLTESSLKGVRNSELPPFQGLSAVLDLPFDSITKPSAAEQAKEMIQDNLGFAIPIFVLVLLGLAWMKWGKDPQGGPMVVQFDPPGDVSGPEAGALIDERVDQRDLAAGIISLAVKGYLTIHPTEEGLVFKRRAADLKLTDKVDGPDLTPFERDMRLKLKAAGDTITPTDLRTYVAPHVMDFRKSIYQSLVDRGYYKQSPEAARNAWGCLGFLAIAGLGVLFYFLSPFHSILPSIVGGILGLIVLAFFVPLMPRRTHEGAKAQKLVKGFEEFMRRARSDDMKWLDEKHPDQLLFEKYLPHAVAFGLTENWAKAFVGIVQEMPSWYVTPYHGGFSPIWFGNDLVTVSNSLASSASTPPRSSGASGGSSGFSSGGGFSGGGFGGGGGGSW